MLASTAAREIYICNVLLLFITAGHHVAFPAPRPYRHDPQRAASTTCKAYEGATALLIAAVCKHIMQAALVVSFAGIVHSAFVTPASIIAQQKQQKQAGNGFQADSKCKMVYFQARLKRNAHESIIIAFMPLLGAWVSKACSASSTANIIAPPQCAPAYYNAAQLYAVLLLLLLRAASVVSARLAVCTSCMYDQHLAAVAL
jgi:hypothetical protein